AAMREHPVIGYEMLKGLHFLESSLEGVRHHHEHWDGGGYPDGVKGEDIPLAVRILTAADALDALTSDRPYRTAMSFLDAVHRIEAGAGNQFDPAVIRALRSRSAAIAALLLVMGKPRRGAARRCQGAGRMTLRTRLQLLGAVAIAAGLVWGSG